ncbi:hypothetical protein [Treponema endosymbiont of Eucomonympha sp.]|uniref:hypothetical protein n=1 Tax=Treponema endosymbiont of Eucomonympha sp. TaxID=1580831 RepID=UPI000AAF2E1C|nr:hypothetical protein [Treponema endosymbiont of Eucomonympha sp.]
MKIEKAVLCPDDGTQRRDLPYHYEVLPSSSDSEILSYLSTKITGIANVSDRCKGEIHYENGHITHPTLLRAKDGTDVWILPYNDFNPRAYFLFAVLESTLINFRCAYNIL